MPRIRLYEPFDFPNILPEINLTSADIENQASAIIYTPDSYKNDKAESQYPIETVPVFYRFMMREQRIPTQNEFYIEGRREMLISGFDLDGQPQDYKLGLIARLKSRTYPSLIRDVHFCKLLESTISEAYIVFYNPALDLLGIDILLIPKRPKEPYYGICLFLDSPDGWRGLRRKRNYRKAYHNVSYIELPKKRPMNVSGIWLYDHQDANRLVQLIRSAR